MASIPSLISDIQKLSLTQQEQLFSYLEEILVVGSQINQVTKDFSLDHKQLKEAKH